MANTSYITIEGDRWDTIAFKAYGSCTNDEMDRIKKANPYENTKDVFKGGIKLTIPIEETKANTEEDLVPPWKKTE